MSTCVAEFYTHVAKLQHACCKISTWRFKHPNMAFQNSEHGVSQLEHDVSKLEHGVSKLEHAWEIFEHHVPTVTGANMHVGKKSHGIFSKRHVGKKIAC